ncbi:MAG: hypothetical protein ACRDT8_06800 [Micromonosporaceae bacterium]
MITELLRDLRGAFSASEIPQCGGDGDSDLIAREALRGLNM